MCFSVIQRLGHSSWQSNSHPSGCDSFKWLKKYVPLQVWCLWHHRHGFQPVAQIRSSTDHILWDFEQSFFPYGKRSARKNEQKMCSLHAHSLTPTLTYVWLFSSLTPASRRSSPSHLPLLSVFECDSSSEMQNSANDSPYQQSIPLNSWKISLDLFFGRSLFDLHNRWTGFDQHWPLESSKSYRWVLHVKAKAFVYMLPASVCVCIMRAASQMTFFFFSQHCTCVVDVWHCRVCLISCLRVWQRGWGVFQRTVMWAGRLFV